MDKITPKTVKICENNEIQRIRECYAKRDQLSRIHKYDYLNPSVYMRSQERERMLIRWIKEANLIPIQEKSVLEIGCGSGDNLIQLIRIGFRPENLTANELIEERALNARERLPSSIKILIGDALKLELEENSFDIILQSTVFTSILDNDFQKRLAERIWSIVKPGGGVLWYDFIYNNPKNPNVRGISIRQIHRLFPEGRIKTWHLTLAPPVSRLVTKIHPSLYNLFNLFPFLRTHVLCWISKDRL